MLELIHSGLLDPAKASTEDELKVILASLLRVITLKLKKKSHFLQESQCIEEIISQFHGHVGFLSPFQKLILGRCLLRNFTPAPVFNEVMVKLKDDLVSKKIDSSVSKVEVLFLLTNIEIFNPKHLLFPAELDKTLEGDLHIEIANGKYDDMIEELEKNDIFKDVIKVSGEIMS